MSGPTTPAPVTPAPPPSVILLLEDDWLSHRLVRKIFLGHEVLAVETVAEALETLRRNPFVDLAVVDYRLRNEHGSTFVAEVRRHAYSEDLPVIAYTSSQDRDVIVRYAELRAQAFYVKPYRADALLKELARAHETGRRERLIEATESACRRMQLKPEEYAGLLNTGAAALEEDVRCVRRLLLSINDPRLHAALNDIATRLPQMGVRVAAPLARQAEAELTAGDFHACTETLSVLDGVAAYIRRRAMDLLSLGDSVVSSGSSRTARATRRDDVAGRNDVPAHLRPVLAQPLGVLGPQVVPGGVAPLLDGARLAPHAAPWAQHPAAAPWLAAMRRLDEIDEAAIDAVADHLSEPPNFEPVMQQILLRTEAARPHELREFKWTTVVAKLGVAKATVFAAAGAAGRFSPRSPLDLAGLQAHAAARIVLGYELGRFLRVTHPHRVAAAVIADELGWWLLANADPVLAALTLARGAHRRDLAQAERELLGGPLGQACASWLAAAGLPALYQDAARRETADDQARVTLAIVALAGRLTDVVLDGEPPAVDGCRDELAREDDEAWTRLAAHGVKPPVAPGEAADLVMTLARSACWIGHEIAHARA